MKSGAILSSRAMLAVTLFGSLSLPLLAQQPASSSPASPTPAQQSPAQQSPASTPPASQPPAAAEAPAAPVADLRPVQVELTQKIDSKTAKNGDSVVAQTKSAVKTADGTEIPKGSKLVGHILAVQPSNGQNAQVALKFDQVEIKGGQNLPVQSQIQSITPAGAAETASASPADAPTSAPQSSGAATAATPRSGSAAPAGAPASSPSPASPSATASGPPAAGTVVAQNGGINITTTAVPGVLLANNAPGQQDPRMSRVSSILLGARRDIELDSGTKMVIGVAASGGGQ